MAGEIQIGGTTFATESGGTVTVANVDSATNRQNLGLEIGVDVQAFDSDTTKNDVANTFTANQIISVTDNTNAALRVTQLGTGNALVVETGGTERMRIDQNGYVTKPNQPSFAAYVAVSSTTFSNAVIVFDDTQHNNGGHYNTTNGRFTAPVDGYYLFSYNVQKSGTALIECQFRKNGLKQQDSYVSQTDQSSGHTANTVVWQLSANDYVDVKCTQGTAYGDYTHFTGHLLS